MRRGIPAEVDPRRVDILKEGKEGAGPVVYWMSRDQRAADNWALLFAQDMALKKKVPLAVIFSLAPEYLGATIRQYGFMLGGLRETGGALAKKGIPMFLLTGSPGDEVAAFVRRRRAAALVTDFDPLRLKRKWKRDVAGRISVPFYEVDAHNIVPCRRASDKQEYAAYTMRPRIKRMLPEFLTPFPPLRRHPYRLAPVDETDWEGVMAGLGVDRSVPEVRLIRPGGRAAGTVLESFIEKRIYYYAQKRNDPNAGAVSGLSPYLHFGHISAQRVALEVMAGGFGKDVADPFLEELIVRRELSDNFCLHCRDYDSFGGFPGWARKSLDSHRSDHRQYVYSAGELDRGRTHDPLWNAAQAEMVITGKMHGYMRMYWAKKILEWSPSPEDAVSAAIYLNDRYSLDGRDPNGYAGIAWSIGGVHDRAWPERPVFGKVRYMSDGGCRSKFDVDAYIQRIGRTSG